MELTAIDWTVIVIYFAVTLGIGLAFRQRAGQSLVEYFVSGRSLPWWIAGTSMVATTFAADTPLAVCGLVAKHGLAGNWFWWAFALGGMFTVFVYARLWRRAEVLTDVEFLELRYAGRPAAFLRGFRAVYFSLLVNPIIIGWVTSAMLKVLNYSVFYSAETEAIDSSGRDWLVLTILLAVVGLYCVLSGMWGVAVTDLVQFVLAMIGCVALAVLAVGHVGGTEALQERVREHFGASQAEAVFRFLPPFHATDAWMPLSSFLVMIGVQWWATWYPGAEPGGGGFVVQRMAACKNEYHARAATLWYQLAHYCLRPWPWLMVSLAALAMYPGLRDLPDPGVGYVMVMRDLSPVGLRGLLLVTFLAAYMSTISTQMNWGASYLVRDVYQRFMKPDATDHQLVVASRWASVLVLLAGGLAAWLMRNTSVDAAWKMLAALGAGTGAVYMLRWFWWRINAWTEIAAMLVSLICYLLLTRQTAGSGSTWTDEHIMLATALATIVTWVLVTLLTPPEPDGVLTTFYRKVRPGGPGWKRVASQAPDVRPDRGLGRSVLASFSAAALIYCVLWGVGEVIFGRVASSLLAGLGAVLSAAATYALGFRHTD